MAPRREGATEECEEGRDRSRPSLFAAEPPPVVRLYAAACAGTAGRHLPGCRPGAGPYRFSFGVGQCTGLAAEIYDLVVERILHLVDTRKCFPVDRGRLSGEGDGKYVAFQHALTGE